MSKSEESRLYYEAHVNFPHASDEQREQVAEFCSRLPSWRLATFEMHKSRQPTGFCTGRSKRLDDIKSEVSQMAAWLKEKDIEVLRWKIEDTLFDSNHDDELESLNGII